MISSSLSKTNNTDSSSSNNNNNSNQNDKNEIKNTDAIFDNNNDDENTDEGVEKITTISGKEEEEMIGDGSINEKKRTYYGLTTSTSSNTKIITNATTTASSTRTSNFQPTVNRAHLLYAIEGLDRYPNYLSRWENKDIDELEHALEETLEKVRSQKRNAMDRRRELQILVDRIIRRKQNDDGYNDWNDFLRVPRNWNELQQKSILDPDTVQAIFRSKMFHRRRRVDEKTITLEDVLSGRTVVELDTGRLEQIMDEECSSGVYSLRIFTKEFCKKLRTYIRTVLKELDEFEEQFACTMNREIMVRDLDNLGLGWLNDILLHLIIRPISRHLYHETDIHDGGDLDWRHGFVATYSSSFSSSPTTDTTKQPTRRSRLVPHTDDSEVTLNICLGEPGFIGGNLNLWGLRGSSAAGTLEGTYEPEIGRALLHSGRELHEVTQLESGPDRYAYVVWTRSWNGIRSTTCPCCWMNNRQQQQQNDSSDDCVCGPRWN